MLLTMRTIYASASLSLSPGESHDFAEAEGLALLAGGYATSVEVHADTGAAAGEPSGAKVVTPKGGKRGGKGSKPAVTDAAAGA